MIKAIRGMLRGLSIFLVFFASLIHIYINYGTKDTELVEITSGGLNPFWTLIFIIIVFILVMWVITGLLVIWWDKIKASPFGSVSVLTFGVILTVILLGSIIGINSVVNLIELNSVALIDNLTIYKTDFQWMLGYSLTGTLINIVLILWK